MERLFQKFRTENINRQQPIAERLSGAHCDIRDGILAFILLLTVPTTHEMKTFCVRVILTTKHGAARWSCG